MAKANTKHTQTAVCWDHTQMMQGCAVAPTVIAMPETSTVKTTIIFIHHQTDLATAVLP